MEPFTSLEAPGAPLDVENVDTDQLVPGRFLNRPRADGLAQFCFRDLRYDGDAPRPAFSLNRPEFRDAKILVAGAIFGSGSSRESAVWALIDPHPEIRPSGFRAVIAASFGDIFFNNACKNGLVPVQLPADACAQLRAEVHASPGAAIRVDLEAQEVRFPSGAIHRFEIDEFRRTCLLNGYDDIGLTLQFKGAIEEFEARYHAETPWLRAP